MNEWSANKTDQATRVWAIFSGMYGVRHTRDFGESVPDVWRQAIQNLKQHEIERGIRRLTSGGSSSPPTLPQFVKACKTIGEDEGPSNPGPHLALPAPKVHPIAAHAQKCLLAWLYHRKQETSESELQDLIREKNRIVDQYVQIQTEDDQLTGKEIRVSLFKAWDRVVEKVAEAA